MNLESFVWPSVLLSIARCRLAVLKLTIEGHWSWWRLLLPLVVLGHISMYAWIALSRSEEVCPKVRLTVLWNGVRR